MEFKARNHHQLAPQVYKYLLSHGVKSPSRNGDVLAMPEVTTLVVTRPWERVNLDPFRDANPFFHLVEAIAMLAPFNDVKLLSYMAKNMASYTDDGETYNAFYGTRIFETWFDQMEVVINTLKKDPFSRQCVVQMWDPADLLKSTKDKACNLMLIFSIDSCGSLSMTSFNRSNDAIWGILTGANVVHLSVFQEFVALALGLEMGPWTHVSNNLHVYLSNPKWPQIALQKDPEYPALYAPSMGSLWDPSKGENHRGFRLACRKLMNLLSFSVQTGREVPAITGYSFLDETVLPAFNAFLHHKTGNSFAAVNTVSHIQDASWRMACQMWLERRYAL